MLTWILGILGVGGVTAIGLGAALSFGLLGFLPAAVTNAIKYVGELVFGVLSWVMTTLLHGEENIWSTKEGAFAIVFTILVSGTVASDSIKSLFTWGMPHLSLPHISLPWKHAEEATDGFVSQPTSTGHKTAVRTLRLSSPHRIDF